MTSPSDAGQHIEVLFPDQGRVLEVDASSDEPGRLAEMLTEALSADSADEAERVIRAGVEPGVRVERRR